MVSIHEYWIYFASSFSSKHRRYSFLLFVLPSRGFASSLCTLQTLNLTLAEGHDGRLSTHDFVRNNICYSLLLIIIISTWVPVTTPVPRDARGLIYFQPRELPCGRLNQLSAPLLNVWLKEQFGGANPNKMNLMRRELAMKRKWKAKRAQSRPLNTKDQNTTGFLVKIAFCCKWGKTSYETFRAFWLQHSYTWSHYYSNTKCGQTRSVTFAQLTRTLSTGWLI